MILAYGMGSDVDTDSRVGYRVEYPDVPKGANGQVMAVPFTVTSDENGGLTEVIVRIRHP